MIGGLPDTVWKIYNKLDKQRLFKTPAEEIIIMVLFSIIFAGRDNEGTKTWQNK